MLALFRFLFILPIAGFIIDFIIFLLVHQLRIFPLFMELRFFGRSNPKPREEHPKPREELAAIYWTCDYRRGRSLHQAGIQAVWLSDGIHSVHVMVLNDTDSSLVKYKTRRLMKCKPQVKNQTGKNRSRPVEFKFSLWVVIFRCSDSDKTCSNLIRPSFGLVHNSLVGDC
ncbi:unnamed protein product, partial [Cuscuta epithymum]